MASIVQPPLSIQTTEFFDTGPDVEEKRPDEAMKRDEKIKDSDAMKKKSNSRLSREEIQEFKIAFAMCCEQTDSQESIHKDKIGELFMTLGYSLDSHHITKLLSDFPPDADGMLSLDLLLEAYRLWKHEDARPPEELRELFNRLVNADGREGGAEVRPGEAISGRGLVNKQPFNQRVGAVAGLGEQNRQNALAKATVDGRINSIIMQALLRQFCHDPTISEEDAAAVIAEVDRTGQGEIDFDDFVRMMRFT